MARNFASRLESGSSRRKRVGSRTSARASATRCLSRPRVSRGRRAEPLVPKIEGRPLDLAPGLGPRDPCAFNGNAMFLEDSSGGDRGRSSEKTIAIRRSRGERRSPAARRSRSRRRSAPRAPRSCAEQSSCPNPRARAERGTPPRRFLRSTPSTAAASAPGNRFVRFRVSTIATVLRPLCEDSTDLLLSPTRHGFFGSDFLPRDAREHRRDDEGC